MSLDQGLALVGIVIGALALVYGVKYVSKKTTIRQSQNADGGASARQAGRDIIEK